MKYNECYEEREPGVENINIRGSLLINKKIFN